MSGIARGLLRLFGWQITGTLPQVPHCLVIFAPHTSNWDFLILLLVRAALGRRIYYLAKHSLFRGPLGWFFRVTGGIPVERRESHRLVDTIASKFAEQSELWIAMAPEGTRAKTDHWKSGFYYIALAAQIPVLLTFIDASRKQFGVGNLFYPTGDLDRDLEHLREAYRTTRGIYPENASDIRFKR